MVIFLKTALFQIYLYLISRNCFRNLSKAKKDVQDER